MIVHLSHSQEHDHDEGRVRARVFGEEATGGGLFLLHCIGSIVSVRHTDPWIARHIFPKSMLP